jgi:hypothetical protein
MKMAALFLFEGNADGLFEKLLTCPRRGRLDQPGNEWNLDASGSFMVR